MWRKRIAQTQMNIDDLEALMDLEIREQIIPAQFAKKQSFADPDFKKLQFETEERGVIKKLLYSEYLDNISSEQTPMSLTTFYRRFREEQNVQSTTMSFTYEAGEMIQFDFIGRKKLKQPKLIDNKGVEQNYEIACGASALSRKLFIKAIRDQSKLPVLSVFEDMLEFFGGVPVLITIDNFKAAIIEARKGAKEAKITPEFQELADYYGFGLFPARSRKPRDKAIVENAVGIAQNDILAPLRNRRFFSLDELNDAIFERLRKVNDRPMQSGSQKSRNARFDEFDRVGFQPLPKKRLEYGVWFVKQRVGQDYRAFVDGSRYSVPSRLLGCKS